MRSKIFREAHKEASRMTGGSYKDRFAFALEMVRSDCEKAKKTEQMGKKIKRLEARIPANGIRVEAAGCQERGYYKVDGLEIQTVWPERANFCEVVEVGCAEVQLRGADLPLKWVCVAYITAEELQNTKRKIAAAKTERQKKLAASAWQEDDEDITEAMRRAGFRYY